MLFFFFCRLDIILKNSRTSFYLLYSLSFNFLFCINLVSEPNFDQKSSYLCLFQVLDPISELKFFVPYLGLDKIGSPSSIIIFIIISYLFNHTF